MTCNERLEQTLNKAGQTISDLPKDYSDTDCMRAYAAVQEWRSENGLTTWHECEKYVLHLTDIIDRLEWALENVCGERDYLKQIVSLGWPCKICVNGDRQYNDKPCNTCLYESDVPFFEYEGVPEDWSVDDEKGL